MQNKKFLVAFYFVDAVILLLGAVYDFSSRGVTSFAGWAFSLAMVLFVIGGILSIREKKL